MACAADLSIVSGASTLGSVSVAKDSEENAVARFTGSMGFALLTWGSRRRLMLTPASQLRKVTRYRWVWYDFSFKKPIYPARDNLKAAISRSLRTSTVSPTKTGWFQVLPSIALKRPTSAN